MTNLPIEIECWNFLFMNAYLEYHQPSTPTLGGKSGAWCVIALGDSNEAKIRVAEYSTIFFQQGQFLSRVRPTKFKANIIAKIDRY